MRWSRKGCVGAEGGCEGLQVAVIGVLLRRFTRQGGVSFSSGLLFPVPHSPPPCCIFVCLLPLFSLCYLFVCPPPHLFSVCLTNSKINKYFHSFRKFTFFLGFYLFQEQSIKTPKKLIAKHYTLFCFFNENVLAFIYFSCHFVMFLHV